jgi:putative phosphonate catabolism associated alcohol dehydrogenase
LGHEIVGSIVDFFTGDDPLSDARNQVLKAGDRITWSIYSSDPDSYFAQKDIPQKGDNLFKYGHEIISHPDHNMHGGLSEYCVIRENTVVVKLDESIAPSAVAPINCAVATVAGGFRLAGAVENKSVLVIGSGMLGIMAIAMAKSKKASPIIALDIDRRRLEICDQFGASDTVNIQKLSKDEIVNLVHRQVANGVEVVFELSGVTESMELSLNLLQIGGMAIWIGATYPGPPISIDGETIVRNLLKIKGLHNYNAKDLVDAVEFIEKHHDEYPFEQLVEKEFSLKEVGEAFDYAIKHKPFRVGINFGA